MTQKQKVVGVVFGVVVTLVGIGSIVVYSSSYKPKVLAAHTTISITPTPQVMHATLEIFSNPVSVILPNQEATSEAKTGMIIPEGTIVSTGTTVRAEISYPGGTVTRLDSSTQIKLTTFDPNRYQILVDLYEGKIWSRIKKLLGNESYETKTSNTVATVRGTSYEHSALINDTDQVMVVDGTVDFGCSNSKKPLRTNVEKNKKSVAHCNTDTELKKTDIAPADLNKEWATFNLNENKKLEEKQEIIEQKENKLLKLKKNDSARPTEYMRSQSSPTAPANDRKIPPGQEKKLLPNTESPTPTTTSTRIPPGQLKKLPTPTTVVSNTVNRVVDTVVTAIPTLPPLIKEQPTTAPIQPTSAPTATSAPSANVNVNVGNVVDVNIGLGNTGAGQKLQLGH